MNSGRLFPQLALSAERFSLVLSISDSYNSRSMGHALGGIPGWGTLHAWTQSLCSRSGAVYYQLHFRDEETEHQQDSVTCLQFVGGGGLNCYCRMAEIRKLARATKEEGLSQATTWISGWTGAGLHRLLRDCWAGRVLQKLCEKGLCLAHFGKELSGLDQML
jgi:hypothetical protein